MIQICAAACGAPTFTLLVFPVLNYYRCDHAKHTAYLAFAGKVGSIICVGGSFDSAWTNPILCTCCKHRRDKWTVILSTRTPPILEHADVHPIRTAQRYIWPWSYSSVHWLSVLLPLHAAVTASTQTHKIVLALRFTYS
jgi:hypothetical protein